MQSSLFPFFIKALKPFYKTQYFGVIFLALPLYSLALPRNSSIRMPYQTAGLTEHQAAAHLLDRFTYGGTSKDVDEIVKIGLTVWFEKQLDGNLPDDDLMQRLQQFDALKYSNTEIADIFRRNGQIIKDAEKAGIIPKDSAKKGKDATTYQSAIDSFSKAMGWRKEQELFRQQIGQKLLRAIFSNNQLHEVLTDFWFNHFNVSLSKNDCALYVPNYERDVIRPNVVGNFYDLLLATAQSPAMLLYLDNFTSSGHNSNFSQQDSIQLQKLKLRLSKLDSSEAIKLRKQINRKTQEGLNENYARELMELHTLGVDGGYTQQDVTQAARVLTGWTIYPSSPNMPGYQQVQGLMKRKGLEEMSKEGFVRSGDFFFAIQKHDDGEKIVLGKKFLSGGEYEEGLTLLHLLANQPATAKFICRKIAVRFVSDNPSQSLINKLAKRFQSSDGNIRAVLEDMVASPEFWKKETFYAKTKSPFELAVSALRVLHADLQNPIPIVQWITKLGQRYYYFQAPTGFPDQAKFWINSGTILSRINFGWALATKNIKGIRFDSNEFDKNSLNWKTTIAQSLLPERDVTKIFTRTQQPIDQQAIAQDTDKDTMNMLSNIKAPKSQPVIDSVSQSLGMIIGSPEFQLR
ncbi:MAG: DUF1800 domain-containing protein [Bacteroidetes bacterium]|nr:DUF1800 domain-containing protein [Bacteroidota bacterium]